MGIPVRVHPVFWLTAAIIAWTSELDIVLVRVLCIFVSVLVHEMGHALTTRYFGSRPEIVLGFFGGYATVARFSTWRNIAVIAAGPAAGFLLFFLMWGIDYLDARQQFLGENIYVVQALYFLMIANLFWSVLNLIPVYPLDGGQISRELFCWISPHKGVSHSLMLSIIASGGVALLSYKFFGLQIMTIFFAILCVQSVQAYQYISRGYR